MKFSENWLRTLVDPPADRAELTRRLTMAGLEVESVEPIGHGLDHVVVAQIVECAPHPNADKLKVCKVDVGGPVRHQVVCGAPNARVGLKAPLARVGARLPNGVSIKPTTIRGTESFGMLCSAKEIALSDDASGLFELPPDAPLGTALEEYLHLPDATIELKLTPNRPDCLGLRGLASEVATLFDVGHVEPAITAVPAATSTRREATLAAPQDCPRYLGRVIEGIDPTARTPLWMVERLRRAGLRSVSAVVDCTSYVMLELGQPTHAFDHDTLDGAIDVRRAKRGEALVLLDGREATLDPHFLVIADAKRAIALAGVMGGHATRVTDATRNLFLEAAHFTPRAIVGRARKLGMHTDASHRFERGVDPAMPRAAIERLTGLLLEIVGGTPGPIVESVSERDLPKREPVLLRARRLGRVLGMAIEPERVEAILRGLGMTVEAPVSDGAAPKSGAWRVTPPSRRFDIEIEEDLIEEVARVHGYDAVPTHAPGGELPRPNAAEGTVQLGDLRRTLAARGYHEAIEFSFVPEPLLATWQLEGGAIALANPLSAELAVMRTALLPGLVEAAKRNAARQQPRIRLFEIGRSYSAGGGEPVEAPRIAGVVCGGAHPEHWSQPRRAVDFHDVKGDIEQLVALTGHASAFRFAPIDVAYLHPGRSAEILRGAMRVGVAGSLHPRLARALDLDRETFVFELDLDPLVARDVRRAASVSRYPSVRRDIAVLVDRRVPYAAIEAAVRAAIGSPLASLALFDQFVGQGLPSDARSLAIGLILQDDSRTLTDEDADSAVASAVERLAGEFGATLRQ
ncbi:MAG TPA: phenylalanine--tRNA ligase subunit beta [Candidatus Saccharimonadia bacterium]|nr:phenylalanine--tRNA ligase subunit beta [Candidatus Saccharimonadia bacterium]